MKFTNLALPALLSAGALCVPTTSPDTTLSERGSALDLHSGYIGMYDNEKCTGNGIENGSRPKIQHNKKCVKFIHNEKVNSTFPFVKIDFGKGVWTVPHVKVFKDTECQHYLGVFNHPKKANTMCVRPTDYSENEGWGSVMSVWEM